MESTQHGLHQTPRTLDPRRVKMKYRTFFAVLPLLALALACGSDQKEIVIGPGEGLTHYVGFTNAIDAAEQFGLPLYLGKVQTLESKITPEFARRLEGLTDYYQVTVQVYEGDRIIVEDGRVVDFVPAPDRPFASR